MDSQFDKNKNLDKDILELIKPAELSDIFSTNEDLDDLIFLDEEWHQSER